VVLNDLWWENWGHKKSLFSAIRAFSTGTNARAEELIENWYEVQRNLSLQVARDFILEHLKNQVRLDAHNRTCCTRKSHLFQCHPSLCVLILAWLTAGSWDADHRHHLQVSSSLQHNCPQDVPCLPAQHPRNPEYFTPANARAEAITAPIIISQPTKLFQVKQTLWWNGLEVVGSNKVFSLKEFDKLLPVWIKPTALLARTLFALPAVTNSTLIGVQTLWRSHPTPNSPGVVKFRWSKAAIRITASGDQKPRLCCLAWQLPHPSFKTATAC